MRVTTRLLAVLVLTLLHAYGSWALAEWEEVGATVGAGVGARWFDPAARTGHHANNRRVLIVREPGPIA